jgi:hypothetical protein
VYGHSCQAATEPRYSREASPQSVRAEEWKRQPGIQIFEAGEGFERPGPSRLARNRTTVRLDRAETIAASATCASQAYPDEPMRRQD